MSGTMVLDRLTAGYQRVPIVNDLSFSVSPGEILCLLGANGAGKTTTARAVMGLAPAFSGSISLDGRALDEMDAAGRALSGIALVSEGGRPFGSMRVYDNLLLGAYRRNRRGAEETMADVYELFPLLEERARQRAGTLSGGQQRMLAIGRAMMARPSILILDEPSLGLAPIPTAAIFEKIADLAWQGLGILLIEQNARAALEISQRAVVIERGRVTLSGDADVVGSDRAVIDAYLGATG